MDKTISQRRFTVVDVSNNGEVTDIFHVFFKRYKQLKRRKRFTIAVILLQMLHLDMNKKPALAKLGGLLY